MKRCASEDWAICFQWSTFIGCLMSYVLCLKCRVWISHTSWIFSSLKTIRHSQSLFHILSVNVSVSYPICFHLHSLVGMNKVSWKSLFLIRLCSVCLRANERHNHLCISGTPNENFIAIDSCSCHSIKCFNQTQTKCLTECWFWLFTYNKSEWWPFQSCFKNNMHYKIRFFNMFCIFQSLN